MNRRPVEPASLSVVLCLVGILIIVGAITIAAAGGAQEQEHGRLRTIGYGQIRYAGLGAERWAQRYREASRQLAGLRDRVRHLQGALRAQRRIVLRKPQVVEAINLACATYGYCATLWRKARCETGGTFSARSYNSSSGAAGILQFLPSTWATTPYARFSVWSPYANALAAGWMHDHGRSSEWSCR